MTITNAIYDAVPVTQETFGSMMASFLGDGYISGYGSELEVVPASTPGMKVVVSDGRARIQGYWYQEDETDELVVSANSSGSTRIDRVILRLVIASPRQISTKILQGTPGAGVPSLAVDGTEISLAKITVASGASPITAAEITDERDDPLVCGIAGVVNFKFSELGAFTANADLEGYKVVALDTPTAAQDAATKAYLDSKFTGGIYGTNRCPILPWVTTTIPSGWLECNGQSLLQASYPNLFSAFGTTYGSVDSTHFNLPDRKGRVSMGATSSLGTLSGAKTVALAADGSDMPAHTHPVGGSAVYRWGYYNTGVANGDLTIGNTSSTGGAPTAHNNLMPYVVVKWIVYGS